LGGLAAVGEVISLTQRKMFVKENRKRASQNWRGKRISGGIPGLKKSHIQV